MKHTQLIPEWGKHNPEFGNLLPFRDVHKVEAPKQPKSNHNSSDRGVYLDQHGRVRPIRKKNKKRSHGKS